MKNQSSSFNPVPLTVLILVALLLFSPSSPLLANGVFNSFLAQLRVLGLDNAPGTAINIDGDNVGIGTIAPKARLHVNDGIYITGGNGDVNGNGFMNAKDAVMIVNYINGLQLTEEEYARADVNGDSYVNKLDYAIVIGAINATSTRGSGPLTIPERHAGKSEVNLSNDPWKENLSTKLISLSRSGNKVSIGTDTKISRLTVDGNIALIGAGTSRTIQLASGSKNLNIRNSNKDRDFNLDIHPDRGRLLIRTYDGTEVKDALLVVKADGKAGVGVDDPVYNLDVKNDINLTGFYRKSGIKAPATGIYQGNNSTAGKVVNVGYKPRVVTTYFDQGTGRVGRGGVAGEIECLKTNKMLGKTGYCTSSGRSATCPNIFALTTTGFKVYRGTTFPCTNSQRNPNATGTWYYIAWP